MPDFRQTIQANSLNQRGGPKNTSVFSGIAYGPLDGFDAGTAGDYFVDGPNGDDGNTGTSTSSAFATIGAAIDAANAAGGDLTIRVMGDGVRYRETKDFIWFDGSPLTNLSIKRYGTDRPVVSGAEIVTGWAPCVSSDSAVVGANWASLHKVTVNTASFPAPKYWRTLMAENGAPLDLCGLRRTGRETPDFFFDNVDQTINAIHAQGSDLVVGLRSGVWYDTIANPGSLGSFTDAQLEQTTAVVHAYPNIAGFMEVTSVTSGALQLQTASLRPANGGADGSYALLNVLPAIEQGQWGYRDNGDGTVTFYCWPNDEANLAAKIEFAVRNEGMRFYRNGHNKVLTIEGIDFEMFAGGGTRDQCLGLDGVTGLTGNQVTIKHCEFRLYAGGRGVECKFAEQGVTLDHCTFRDGIGFGFSTTPSTGAGAYLFDYRVRNCLAQDISQTGFRMFGVRDCVMHDIKAVRTSGGGHANAINFYQGCDRIAVVNYQGGITFDDKLYAGYGTNQSSSRLYFLHCTFTLAQDGRAYVDQNISGETLPTPGGGGHLINCWVPHEQALLNAQDIGGITVGRDIMDWQITNTITPAIVNTGGTLTRKSNILTNSTATADATEELVSANALHKNPDNFDYRAKNNSRLKSKTGEPVDALVASLESWFPGEDFRRDANGRPWDPANPGVGPLGSNWP